jgi:hypothetical protein
MISKTYKCGCKMIDTTIVPCTLHFVIIDDKLNVLRHKEITKGLNINHNEFTLIDDEFKQIIEMLETEEKERLK